MTGIERHNLELKLEERRTSLREIKATLRGLPTSGIMTRRLNEIVKIQAQLEAE